MKKLILATALVAITASSSSAASIFTQIGNDIKNGLTKAFDPHENGVISLSNGGYKSWKERIRSCEGFKNARYDKVYNECIIVKVDKFGNAHNKVYRSTQHIKG